MPNRNAFRVKENAIIARFYSREKKQAIVTAARLQQGKRSVAVSSTIQVHLTKAVRQHWLHPVHIQTPLPPPLPPPTPIQPHNELGCAIIQSWTVTAVVLNTTAFPPVRTVRDMLCSVFIRNNVGTGMKKRSLSSLASSAGVYIAGMDGLGPGTVASRNKRDETSRRLALLFAIFLASALMVTTCLGFLALSKSQYGWRLISIDLIDESQKSIDQQDLSSRGISSVSNILGVDSNRKVTPNEEKLILALQNDLMKSCLLYILCWLGSVKCLVTFVLIYGIFVRSYAHMLAWVIVSILCGAAALISIITAIPDNAPLMNYCTIATILTLLFVYVLMISMIMQYIKRVSSNYRRLLHMPSVKTYAGCVHTLNINKHTDQTAPELPKKEPLIA